MLQSREFMWHILVDTGLINIKHKVWLVRYWLQKFCNYLIEMVLISHHGRSHIWGPPLHGWIKTEPLGRSQYNWVRLEAETKGFWDIYVLFRISQKYILALFDPNCTWLKNLTHIDGCMVTPTDTCMLMASWSLKVKTLMICHGRYAFSWEKTYLNRN